MLLSFFAITPLNPYEYVGAKVFSLCAISMIVAGALALVAGGKVLPVLGGTFLSSVMFTLFGVIIATKIKSLNQFILATVPVEILGFVPGLLHLFGVTPKVFGIYPANSCMDMIAGRSASPLGIVITLVLIALLFFIASRCVRKMWIRQEGVKF